MTRSEVYAAIDGERAFQEKVWGKDGERRAKCLPGDGPEHAVGNWMVFMSRYMRKAEDAMSDVEGEETALDMLRKVVALGVACFEQHGCPLRQAKKAG